MPQAIDAVITWVDGDDPKLIAKQRAFFEVDEKDDVTSAGRFVDCNEIFYCVSAILKNLKFIARIFIVTDDQYPPVIDQIREKFGNEAADRIRVVDHKAIFAGYEEYLPTFNSVSIETMMHRIPDLSDRYIYFNDDFIVVRPMEEADFFNGNRLILRGKWRKMSAIDFNVTQRTRMLEGKVHFKGKLFSYKECQAMAYKTMGFHDEFFWHDHTPHPFFRSDLDEFFAVNEDKLIENIRHRIRHSSQYDPMSLANGLDIKKGGSTFQPMSLTYLKASVKRFQNFYVWRKSISAKKHNSHFICLQALVEAKPKALQKMLDWMDELLFSDGK